MSEDSPRVSIGLPVFNGEKYLAETLDSLLAQTYSDFELIISDNASTDGTQEICQAYAAEDGRIRYVRNETNLGASKNFNRVFELASGEYFKWAAHDDLCAPEYLERCIEVLDRDASVILCHSETMPIDEHGALLPDLDARLNVGSPKPHERFLRCLCVPHGQCALLGVIRADALGRTRLVGRYAAADRVLLGELALFGRFYEVPEYLFFYRIHPQQSWRRYATRQSREAWFDPTRAGKITFPHWRLFREHLISIGRAPLSWYERTWCYIYMGWWVGQNWRGLSKDLIPRPSFRSAPARYRLKVC